MAQDPIILIAEDDEGHALLIRENLALAGRRDRIEHFSDGQAILDFFFGPASARRAGAGQMYLVLLDINMPKVDGLEVLRRLKADNRVRNIPVYVLTTSDDERTIERCHFLGCSAYLQKPTDYDEFERVIRHLGEMIPHGRYAILPPEGGGPFGFSPATGIAV
ncbi:MAG TPA: response regulator [Opitutaceae bacterium]|jgi:CheY-like chemotaxis protein|nr:response regulator [Opitutaceae bacterium]